MGSGPAVAATTRSRPSTRSARGPNPSRRWVLDADLAAAFDRIDHHLLLAQLGTFPARDRSGRWLKAGVVENGRLTPTEEGTPQGGVVSPVLLNVALHGMEQAAGVRYQLIGTHAGKTVTGSPVLIRYADDLVALCTTKAQAERVKARLAAWLAPRGLAFNEDKTRIVTLDEGFDFLGFNVRRYGGKLLIKPEQGSPETDPGAAPRPRCAPCAEPTPRGAATAQPHHAGVGGLLPDGGVQRDVLRAGPLCVAAHLQVGQAQPPEQVEALDHQPVLRQVQQVQARPLGVRRPPQRRLPREVRLDQDRPTPDGQGGGVTGRPGPGRVLGQRRRRAAPPPLDNLSLRLLQSQRGRCQRCGELLLVADHPPQSPHEWEQWVRTTGKALAKRAMAYQERGTSDDGSTLRLIHARCC